jgi:hypothetical protein
VGSFGAGFTDGDVVDAADLNTIAGAWDSFTVTFTNLTLGNGTAVGFYKQVGRVVCYRVQVTFGSTTSITGNVDIALPVTGAAVLGVHQALFIDASPSTTYSGMAAPSTTVAQLRAMNSSATYTTLAAVAAAVPFTWTTNDIIRISGVYEAAS